MESFTNPPSNTYMLGVRFLAPRDGLSVPAVAVASSAFPVIVAAYTIVIQLLFVAVWKLMSNSVLTALPLSDHVNILGAVSFWNSPDPFTATFHSLNFLGMLTRRRGELQARWGRHWLPAFGIFVLSFCTAGAGVVVAIVYPDRLQIASVAPVHPAAVYWPYVPEVGNSTVSDIMTYARPSILRALGSAEAAKDHSQLRAVNVGHFEMPESNETHPHIRIDYNYDITAEDLGVQSFPDLVLQFNGSCSTTYDWLHRAEQGWDAYIPWGNASDGNSFPVANEKVGRPSLDFACFIHPDINTGDQLVNRSFAFAVATSQVASFSPSTDPWYYTEPAPKASSIGAPYIVKSGRPALSCWETTQVCLQGLCWDTNFSGSGSGGGNDAANHPPPLPDGLAYIIRSRFHNPMSISISLSTGVTTLKSYTGSASGAVIDAHAASLFGEMERLILASYLRSRQVFRDIAIADRPPGAPNVMEIRSGQLRDGAADFTISTSDVVALRLDLLIVAPVLAATCWFAVGLLTMGRHWADGSTKLSKRAAALSAPQLLRMLHESLAESRGKWRRKRGWLPLPPTLTGFGTATISYRDRGAELDFERTSVNSE